MLNEILEERRQAKEKLDKEARLGMTLGLLLRYFLNGFVWVVLMLGVGVAVVVYAVVRIIFGSMGK